MSGKGHAPRPFSVPLEEFAASHELIFGKKVRQQYVPPPLPSKENNNEKDENGH